MEERLGEVALEARDHALMGGADALVARAGRLTCEAVLVRPAGSG